MPDAAAPARLSPSLRVFVTGGTGVLGRAALPLLRGEGYDIVAPGSSELDLFDPRAVAAAVDGSTAVLHLATRIPSPAARCRAGAWAENDRLRAEASRILVDAALRAPTVVYVQPTVTFVYPDGPADEDTPLGEVPSTLRSALVAEEQAARFVRAGRRGVVLRLGVLDGPGTENPAPAPAVGATLHADDAGRALVAALTVASGTYNVCRDGERVSNARFRAATGWRPER